MRYRSKLKNAKFFKNRKVYRADIKPAKEAGWNTIYYTNENIENEVTTNNLVDVLQLIS